MLLKTSEDKGYSLFELVVVISLLGIMLLFVLPAFQNFLTGNDISATSGKISSLIKELKTSSVIDQKNYFLKYNTDRRVLYIWTEDMNEEDEADSIDHGIRIDDDIIFEVETALRDKVSGFYREGYSDPATLKLTESGKNITIKIRPFLIKPEVNII